MANKRIRKPKELWVRGDRIAYISYIDVFYIAVVDGALHGDDALKLAAWLVKAGAYINRQLDIHEAKYGKTNLR